MTNRLERPRGLAKLMVNDPLPIGLDESWLDGLSDRTGNGTIDAADVADAFRERGDHLVLRLDSDTGIILKGLASQVLEAGDFLVG